MECSFKTVCETFSVGTARSSLKALANNVEKRTMMMPSLTKSTVPSFSFNHTAFKLYSLWHVGCLLDDFYDLHTCSRASLLLYNPARHPDSIEPPRLLGSMPSYFSVAVVLYLLTLLYSPPPLPRLRSPGPVAQRPTSRLCYFRLPASCLPRSAPRIRACPL
jgi:hypothetical protein